MSITGLLITTSSDENYSKLPPFDSTNYTSVCAVCLKNKIPVLIDSLPRYTTLLYFDNISDEENDKNLFHIYMVPADRQRHHHLRQYQFQFCIFVVE